MYLLGLGVSLARALLLLVCVTTFPQTHLLVSAGHSRKELSLWRQSLAWLARDGAAAGRRLPETLPLSGESCQRHCLWRATCPWESTRVSGSAVGAPLLASAQRHVRFDVLWRVPLSRSRRDEKRYPLLHDEEKRSPRLSPAHPPLRLRFWGVPDWTRRGYLEGARLWRGAGNTSIFLLRQGMEAGLKIIARREEDRRGRKDAPPVRYCRPHRPKRGASPTATRTRGR